MTVIDWLLDSDPSIRWQVPGEEVAPPQPMVGQIRAVLDAYQAGGGDVEVHILEGCAHGPHFDCAEKWNEIFFGFLARH